MDDPKKHISQIREDFTKGTLNEKDVTKDPAAQFELWLQQAITSNVPEVQAAHLATVSEQNKPSGRIVYLREFKQNKFWFYTNYNSKKGKDLLSNPFASLTFFWPELERQIRIEGTVSKASEADSDNYYNARPYESKIGAWASEQSSMLKSREELEKRIEGFQNAYPANEIKRPDFWGGYIITANYYEFWQGRKSRLHDRICYELKNVNWEISRLAP